MSTIIITEKPSACKKISQILDENGNPTKIKIKNIEYYKSTRDGEILLVVPALGHLFTVSHKKNAEKSSFEYPVFDLIWIPLHEKIERSRVKDRKSAQMKNLLDIFKKVSQVCSKYIVACDYDIEGSTIGYKILEYCIPGDKIKEAQRMKFSSLTESEILESYNNPLKPLDFNLIESGICRHEVDYLFGINLTHALTKSTTKLEKIKFFLLSTGRVQGPTLSEIVRREREISSFIPEKYWEITGKLIFNDNRYTIEHTVGKYTDETAAETALNDCKGKNGVIKNISKSEVLQYPPVPYNLSDLQDDAYNYFKYNPSNTLKIAEQLYLESLISYPRTSNQKIPKSINTKEIISSLQKDPQYKEICQKLLKTGLVPNEGKKTDPAHPPIIPTGNLPTKPLSKINQNIFNLILYRFFSVFGENAVFEKIKYDISVGNQQFHLTGKKLIKNGWLAFDPFSIKRIKSGELPEFKLNQSLEVDIAKKTKFTKPPPRYNPNSIRKWMENNDIGTKATRSEIIKLLYDRKYIFNESIEPSKIGIGLIEVLEKYVPEILSTEFTRDLELNMNKIETDEITRSEIIDLVKKELSIILEKFKKDEPLIGKDLESSILQTYEDQNTIGKCPNCSDGYLKIMYSKEKKKRFIGCSSYPNCHTSFPVSQKGLITPLNKECPQCKKEFNKSFPLIRLKIAGKRPFSTCVNWNNCPKFSKKKKGKVE